VSDAGTPGISDPGMVLASAAIAEGIPVIPIPGASAGLAALVASGLNTERFCFAGFLPPKAGARRTALEDLSRTTPVATTLIIYEAPHRILDTLADIGSVWGPDCRIVLARELTKIHEEFLRGTIQEVRKQLAARESLRGEMVLLVETRPVAAGAAVRSTSVEERLAELMQAEGLTEKDALKRIARERGTSKSDIWRELQRERARAR